MNATRERLENLVMRIQSSFLDDPYLTMTLPTAATRFGVEGTTCAAVLATLADANVLIERDGIYRRLFPGRSARCAA